MKETSCAEEIFYTKIAGMVLYFRFGLQSLIGFFIIGFILFRIIVAPFLDTESIGFELLEYLVSEHLGTIIASALYVSAAVEIAYMLFTPGPDEAIDPVLISIAATIILVVSSFPPDESSSLSTLYLALGVLLLALSLGVLAWARKALKDDLDL